MWNTTLSRASRRCAITLSLRRCFSSRLELPTDRVCNLAVIGTGRMGELRIKGMHMNPNVHLSAIVSEDSIRSTTLSWDFNVSGPSSLDEVLSDPKIDGIWISTPTDTHLNLIRACAEAKKHIAVEKPIGATLREIDHAYLVAQEFGVHLLCSFQRRFDPHYRALSAQLEKAKRIQSIIGVFRDHPMPPLEFLMSGGDPFHDLAVHDIDYICSTLMASEKPTRVLASGSSSCPELASKGVMDTAAVWIEFQPSGVIAYLDLSRGSSYGYDQRLEVFTSTGEMMQVMNPPQTSTLRSSARGVQGDVFPHSFPERFARAYELELEHFVDLISGNTESPLVTHHEARWATIVAEAAKQSAMRKCRIEIEIDSDDDQRVHYHTR